MITIDGKSYPMWSQFVEDKDYVGGTLEEFSDGISPGGVTTIIKITLEKNDDYGDIPFLTIHGKDFSEEFRVDYGGVSGGSEPGWLNFHTICCDFRIKKAGA